MKQFIEPSSKNNIFRFKIVVFCFEIFPFHCYNKCFHYLDLMLIYIKFVLVQGYYKLLCSLINLYQINKVTKSGHVSIYIQFMPIVWLILVMHNDRNQSHWQVLFLKFNIYKTVVRASSSSLYFKSNQNALGHKEKRKLHTRHKIK